MCVFLALPYDPAYQPNHRLAQMCPPRARQGSATGRGQIFAKNTII